MLLSQGGEGVQLSTSDVMCRFVPPPPRTTSMHMSRPILTLQAPSPGVVENLKKTVSEVGLFAVTGLDFKVYAEPALKEFTSCVHSRGPAASIKEVRAGAGAQGPRRQGSRGCSDEAQPRPPSMAQIPRKSLNRGPIDGQHVVGQVGQSAGWRWLIKWAAKWP